MHPSDKPAPTHPVQSGQDPTIDFQGGDTSQRHGTLAQTPAEQKSSELRSQAASTKPIIAGFEIQEEIGRGGMGVVYRARDFSLHRDVAIKVLHERYGSDVFATARFLDEARITGQLQHPGIPPVYQMGFLSDGRPYLAMKLIKGRTLDEIMKGPREDRPNFFSVCEAVCQAIGYAHSRGVIHRDLKPSNVMVGGFGEVQVMDWGLAKVLGQSPRDRQPDQLPTCTQIHGLRDSDTHAGSVLGTPAYMSPEQALGQTDCVDQRSDVFSLAAILCTFLTGEPPYTGDDFDSVLRSAAGCRTEPAIGRMESSGADPALVELARQSFSIDPKDRPADANVLATEIARIRASADERARQALIELANQRVFLEERRKRRGLMVLLVTALAVGSAASIIYAVKARNAVAEMEEAQAKQKQAEARLQVVSGRIIDYLSTNAHLLKSEPNAFWKGFIAANPDIELNELKAAAEAGGFAAGSFNPTMFGD